MTVFLRGRGGVLSEARRFCTKTGCYFELFIIPPTLTKAPPRKSKQNNSPKGDAATTMLHRRYDVLLAISGVVFASKTFNLGCIGLNLKSAK